VAFLWAQPHKLVCYDLAGFPEADPLQPLTGQTELVLHRADGFQADLEETDLLFLTAPSAPEQLTEGLRRQALCARRFLVLTGTAPCAGNGQTNGQRGVWPAVEAFVAEGNFRLKRRYETNNGLTILERVSD
jgi:hypothetical protein